MNKLNLPAFFNDQTAIQALANNHLLKSYPALLPHLAAIQAGYAQYVAVGGDAKAVLPVALPESVKVFLRGHYASPPKAIDYIDKIRLDGEVKTCPMCGSMSGGTLDHVLPKTDFAAFAVFGLNLVPACKCNGLRSTTLTGPGPGQRILHPYFDAILADRLLAARFDDLGPVPRVSIRALLDPADPAYPGVQFHVANVVARTHVTAWLRDQWIKLVRKPSLVIRDLRTNPASREDLVAILEEELATQDEAYESKNSWYSMFAAGLLDADVIDWLYLRLSQPGRADNAELVGV